MASARQIRSETTGKWMFKSTRVVGLDEFKASWRTAAVRDVPFDHSGYVLGNYLDAQDAVNHAQIFAEQSDDATALAKAFTAAFPFEQPVALPDLAPAPLAAFCREEYGEEDAAGMADAIQAAHRFYQLGFAEITAGHLVVFLIE
jgi:hypothetical protein